MTPTNADETARLRNAVGRWLRIKSERPYDVGQKAALDRLMAGGAADMYRQLAADAEHSVLLWRLIEGKEPK